MKKVVMKGKNVEEATKAGIEVLGVSEDKVKVNVLKEGRPAMLGMIGGEEAEVEVMVCEELKEEAKQILQNILDKMGFLAIAEIASEDDETINLEVKGEDMGRIIGKEGAMLKSLEIIVGNITFKTTGQRKRISIDAGEYKVKRVKSLERLAKEVIDEVLETGTERILPPMSPADRRAIHLYVKDHDKVASYSQGEGKERRLVISLKK